LLVVLGHVLVLHDVDHAVAVAGFLAHVGVDVPGLKVLEVVAGGVLDLLAAGEVNVQEVLRVLAWGLAAGVW